ncbi:hypothetical protein [Lacisediminimonas profundi]|uniref:hypothetical protein n=1 Tax=Lacisediminimonas profundi TaxID=2603856 RepID=UPI00124B67A4|nr:hypothetical protein [Lacisediminimonas profundi]
MSMINVFLSPSKALIGVDTEGINGLTGDFIRVGKMIYLPQVNIVLAGRGTAAFLLVLHTMLTDALMRMHGGGDFDSAAAAMPELVGAAYKAINAAMPDVGLYGIPEGQQAVLIGWSAIQSRMQACAYLQSPSAEVEVVNIEDPGYMMPWNAAWGEPPEGCSPADMVELALCQVRNVKCESPGTPMGGNLIIAELSRSAMSVRDMGKLVPRAADSRRVFGMGVAVRVRA